jgi:hypothetical protein
VSASKPLSSPLSTETPTSTRWLYLAIAFGVAVLARFVSLPETWRTVGELTLTLQGQAALGVLLFALVLWMTEAIPFHITGLLGDLPDRGSSVWRISPPRCASGSATTYSSSSSAF